jgi:hypothetical protein
MDISQLCRIENQAGIFPKFKIRKCKQPWVYDIPGIKDKSIIELKVLNACIKHLTSLETYVLIHTGTSSSFEWVTESIYWNSFYFPNEKIPTILGVFGEDKMDSLDAIIQSLDQKLFVTKQDICNLSVESTSCVFVLLTHIYKNCNNLQLDHNENNPASKFLAKEKQLML